jgi:anti-sigma B factor antagonist
MALEVLLHPHSDPLVVRLSGRMTLGPHLLAFGRRITELLTARSFRAVLLDMTAVEELDSAGLGELVILYTAANELGCRLCLFAPPSRVTHLLESTRLTGILPHFADRQAAEAWVSGNSV